MGIEEEIESVKTEIIKLQKEMKEKEAAEKKVDKKEIEKALKILSRSYDIEPKPIAKKQPVKNAFIIMAFISKLVVFGTFVYTSAVMYTLDRSIESVLILIVAALFIMLNKMEGG